jgi:hypothetical protein
MAYHEHNEAKTDPRADRGSVLESAKRLSRTQDPAPVRPRRPSRNGGNQAGITVSIPGASALLSALVASGLGADRFTFRIPLHGLGVNATRRWTRLRLFGTL